MMPVDFIEMLRNAGAADIAEIRRLLGMPDGRHHLELTGEELKADKRRWAREIVEDMKKNGELPP